LSRNPDQIAGKISKNKVIESPNEEETMKHLKSSVLMLVLISSLLLTTGCGVSQGALPTPVLPDEHATPNRHSHPHTYEHPNPCPTNTPTQTATPIPTASPTITTTATPTPMPKFMAKSSLPLQAGQAYSIPSWHFEKRRRVLPYGSER